MLHASRETSGTSPLCCVNTCPHMCCQSWITPMCQTPAMSLLVPASTETRQKLTLPYIYMDVFTTPRTECISPSDPMSLIWVKWATGLQRQHSDPLITRERGHSGTVDITPESTTDTWLPYSVKRKSRLMHANHSLPIKLPAHINKIDFFCLNVQCAVLHCTAQTARHSHHVASAGHIDSLIHECLHFRLLLHSNEFQCHCFPGLISRFSVIWF